MVILLAIFVVSFITLVFISLREPQGDLNEKLLAFKRIEVATGVLRIVIKSSLATIIVMTLRTAGVPESAINTVAELIKLF